jgi:hypothetical protein
MNLKRKSKAENIYPFYVERQCDSTMEDWKSWIWPIKNNFFHFFWLAKNSKSTFISKTLVKIMFSFVVWMEVCISDFYRTSVQWKAEIEK